MWFPALRNLSKAALLRTLTFTCCLLEKLTSKSRPSVTQQNKIKNLRGFSINESTVQKWRKREDDLDRV